MLAVAPMFCVFCHQCCVWHRPGLGTVLFDHHLSGGGLALFTGWYLVQLCLGFHIECFGFHRRKEKPQKVCGAPCGAWRLRRDMASCTKSPCDRVCTGAISRSRLSCVWRFCVMFSFVIRVRRQRRAQEAVFRFRNHTCVEVCVL